MGGHKGNETCDARAAMVFLIGLAAGTGCTITSKMLFQMSAPNSFGTMQKFTPPLFQTWVMFVGMAFALPAHYFAEWRRRANATAEELAIISREPKVTSKTYMMLAIPSVFDLIATCLMVLGLLYTNASVWMLLRGGGIIFVSARARVAAFCSLPPPLAHTCSRRPCVRASAACLASRCAAGRSHEAFRPARRAQASNVGRRRHHRIRCRASGHGVHRRRGAAGGAGPTLRCTRRRRR